MYIFGYRWSVLCGAGKLSESNMSCYDTTTTPPSKPLAQRLQLTSVGLNRGSWTAYCNCSMSTNSCSGLWDAEGGVKPVNCTGSTAALVCGFYRVESNLWCPIAWWSHLWGHITELRLTSGQKGLKATRGGKGSSELGMIMWPPSLAPHWSDPESKKTDHPARALIGQTPIPRSLVDPKRIKTSAVIRDLDWAEIKMRSDVIIGYCGQRNVDPCAWMWPSRNLLLLHLYISLWVDHTAQYQEFKCDDDITHGVNKEV